MLSSYSILFWSIFFLSIFLAYCIYDLPDISNLNLKPKQPSIVIKDINDIVLAKYGDTYGNALTFNQLPRILVKAVIATEDRKFFQHHGIDFLGILRAAYYNQKAGKTIQGGSTITQQLAKILFLTPEKNLKRKIQEAILAILLEKNFSKEHILAIYLNRVFLGQGIFGIDAAAHYYFGKNIQDLTLYEVAVIVGMLKAPSKYSPIYNKKLSLMRAKQVLINMHDASYISYQQMRTAKPPMFMPRESGRGALKNLYFTDYIIEMLPEIVGNINNNIIVYTTFDIHMQNKLEEVLTNTLNYSEKQYNISQVAAICIEKDGAIKAMMGGKSYIQSQFNRATTAQRQPGSAFKLYVYLNALEKGLDINEYIEDKPIRIGKWSPKNYSRKFLGSITVKEAFAKSINTVAVRLSEHYGRKNVINTAYKLGVVGNLQNIPSIALGTGELTLQELTASYASITNSGHLTTPYAILKITKNNKIIYKKQKVPVKKVLSNNTVKNMLKLLESSVSYGTSSDAKIKNLKIYGKTGTTQNYRDAWFIGFNDNLITGVWVGNDDNKPMKNVTGGKIPLLIWTKFTKKLLQ